MRGVADDAAAEARRGRRRRRARARRLRVLAGAPRRRSRCARTRCAACRCAASRRRDDDRVRDGDAGLELLGGLGAEVYVLMARAARTRALALRRCAAARSSDRGAHARAGTGGASASGGGAGGGAGVGGDMPWQPPDAARSRCPIPTTRSTERLAAAARCGVTQLCAVDSLRRCRPASPRSRRSFATPAWCADGQLFCWGKNELGQLGTGDHARSRPRRLASAASTTGSRCRPASASPARCARRAGCTASATTRSGAARRSAIPSARTRAGRGRRARGAGGSRLRRRELLRDRSAAASCSAGATTSRARSVRTTRTARPTRPRRKRSQRGTRWRAVDVGQGHVCAHPRQRRAVLLGPQHRRRARHRLDRAPGARADARRRRQRLDADRRPASTTAAACAPTAPVVLGPQRDRSSSPQPGLERQDPRAAYGRQRSRLGRGRRRLVPHAARASATAAVLLGPRDRGPARRDERSSRCSTPNPVRMPDRYARVALGNFHTCAVDTAGALLLLGRERRRPARPRRPRAPLCPDPGLALSATVALAQGAKWDSAERGMDRRHIAVVWAGTLLSAITGCTLDPMLSDRLDDGGEPSNGDAGGELAGPRQPA